MTGEPVERAQAKMRAYLARGMSLTRMSEQTGLGVSTLHYCQTNAGMLAVNWEAIMRMPFVPPAGSTLVPGDGARRRLGGLWRDGFPLPFLADRLGVDRSYLQRIIRGGMRAGRGATPHTVTADTAAVVRELYDKLSGSQPGEFGLEPRSIAFAATLASKKGVPPRHCWDPDTIDDPGAHPEWTGACGTRQGVYIHHRDRIPMCVRCKERRIPDGVPRLRPGALGRFRKAAGLSLSELGERLDLHTSTVYYWETGRSAPKSREIVEALAGVLDVPIEELSEER